MTGTLLTNIRPELDEISIANNEFCADHRSMQDELAARNIPGAAVKAADAAKKAGQMQIMLDHIAKVLVRDEHTTAAAAWDAVNAMNLADEVIDIATGRVLKSRDGALS